MMKETNDETNTQRGAVVVGDGQLVILILFLSGPAMAQMAQHKRAGAKKQNKRKKRKLRDLPGGHTAGQIRLADGATTALLRLSAKLRCSWMPVPGVDSLFSENGFLFFFSFFFSLQKKSLFLGRPSVCRRWRKERPAFTRYDIRALAGKAGTGWNGAGKDERLGMQLKGERAKVGP